MAKRVLIVDDDENVRVLVRLSVASKSIEILEAPDGMQALEIARKHHPDIVLLDMMMPHMNGLEVCREIRADPDLDDTIVVMLTAQTLDADRTSASDVGADDYFVKPFSPAELEGKLRALLEKPKRAERG